MEINTESNEWFDCHEYPEKEDPINKQGITIKGSRDRYLEIVDKWRMELSANYEEREYG